MATAATAVYLRQSKDSEGNELAIDRQREGCLKLCRDKGWNNIREYPDNDRSASNGKTRENYQLMLKDITAGKVARVVVWDLDRLHRQPIELEHFMQLADSKQLALATVTGDVDLATDNGRLFARIKGAVAMAEVERKSARQKAAAEQMAISKDGGRPWWPQRPFGFDADRDPVTKKWWTAKRNPTVYNKIRLQPTEAKLLEQAYKDFLNGTPLYSIAARWNDAGVKTTRDNKWSGSRVRELLLLARNAGLREFRGEVVGKGTWDPIVDEDTWRAAHSRITHPARRTGPFQGRKYLLSGIARCGVCAAPVTSHISARGKRQYACNNSGCRRVSRDGVKVDEIIIDAVVGRLSRDDAVDLLRPSVDEVDINALRAERKSLHDGLTQLGKDFAAAPAEFRQSALADIQSRLAEIEPVLNDPGKAAIFEDVIGAENVAETFDDLDLGRQRAIVDALMTITIQSVGKGTARIFDPEAIDVVWKQEL
jgi:DNA invertase Pin-like site-specific DNA recombinase